MCRIWRPPRNSIFVRSKLLLQVISLLLIFTLRIDVYALRDLMGHCYVHFAFLFTLKSRQNPWIDNAIVKLMHRRDYLKRKAVSTKNSQLWKAYKLIRNKITATIRRAKKEYYHSSIEENKGNPSKLWRILGKLTGSKHKEEIPVHLTADQFNLFYSKVGLDTVAQLKPKQNDSKSGENHIYWRGSKCISNFNITEVPNASIENLLSTLDDKSSNDILGFDSKLLWLCCDIISPLITKFVNASIITNHVLLDWKVSRVQSWGQFRFCNSIPIPIPIKAIPLQFRIRYPIQKAIQFQFQFR